MNGEDMPAKHAKRTELEDTATVAEAAAAAADDLADRLGACPATRQRSEAKPGPVRQRTPGGSAQTTVAGWFRHRRRQRADAAARRAAMELQR